MCDNIYDFKLCTCADKPKIHKKSQDEIKTK